MIKLSDLCQPLNGNLLGSDADFQFVSFNTRELQPGEIYIALKGEKLDGHNFVKQAEEAGAVAAIVEHPVEGITIPCLQVTDTLQALTDLARWRWQQNKLPTLAVTGSCGKTTVKEMARAILAEIAPVLASQKTFNNHWGVPHTLLRCSAEHRFAVIEMGANHSGEIKHLTQIVQPHVAIITNVGPAHLEGFGSLEGIAHAKAEIYQGLAKHGIAIVNVDDEFADFWLQQMANQHHTVNFGLTNQADFSARNIAAKEEGCYSFDMLTPVGEIAIDLHLPGYHQITNALAAAAGCWALAEVDLEIIREGLGKLAPVPGRLAPKQTVQGARILDDTYNANLSSVTAALEVLAQFSGERILILGDMRELGTEAEKHHKEVGRRARKLGIDRLYTCGKLTAFTAKAFGHNAWHFTTQDELIKTLQAETHSQMTLLVKGSRGSKMENVVEALLK